MRECSQPDVVHHAYVARPNQAIHVTLVCPARRYLIDGSVFRQKLHAGVMPENQGGKPRSVLHQRSAGNSQPASVQVVQWLARYKPRQLAKSGAVKAVMQALCQLCAEADPPEHDDADQLPAAKFAAQVTQHCPVL